MKKISIIVEISNRELLYMLVSRTNTGTLEALALEVNKLTSKDTGTRYEQVNN